MIDNRILTLAALQHGLIARTQLYGFGISAKRIQRARTSGWFRPIFPDVFLIAPSADTFAMRCRAIQLWVDGAGFVSGYSAGRLRGLARMRPWPIEYTVPDHVTRSTPAWVRLHRTAWYDAAADREELESGLFVARPLRMLFGLAASTRWQRIFDDAADDAWHTKLIEPAEVARYLDAHRCRGKDGVARIDRWLQRVATQERPAQSYFERDLAAALVATGLPAPVRQHRLELIDTSVIHLDLAWPEIRLAIEPGHSRFHHGATALERDTLRDLACAELGWEVHRLTESAQADLPGVAQRIARIHAHRRADLAPRPKSDPERTPVVRLESDFGSSRSSWRQI